jgi:hypothetical protein
VSEKQVPHVYAAIAEVTKQMAIAGISKDRKNQQQGYQFRGIDDVLNALAPVLAEHGLCILPKCKERIVTERATQKGGVLFYVVVHADFDFVSAVDGSVHTVSMYGEAMDSADKATNKAMSAAYKYAAIQAFCIPTEGDNDADATTPQPAAKRAAPPKPSKKELEIIAAFQGLKQRFVAVSREDLYYDHLQGFGVKHCDEFREARTADARQCCSDMAKQLKALEAAK